jgi:rhodanese-related sulfurtransferase
MPVTGAWRKEFANMRNPRIVFQVLLFWAIIGAFQYGGILLAQENADPASAKIQVIHPEVPRIPAEELRELLGKKADIVLVDTNPPSSYEIWHIPSAVNIPYASIDGTAKRDAMLAQLPKDKMIVLYCFCEEGADSSEMALLLRRMHYRRDSVKVLEGGLIQWEAKGYPMYKNENPEGE